MWAGPPTNGRCSRESFDNLLVQIAMIRLTGLARWEFEFSFLGCLTYTFLSGVPDSAGPQRGNKLSILIAFICTTTRKIPASASTNRGPGKSDLIVLHPQPPEPSAMPFVTYRFYNVYRQGPSGPVDPSFRALCGRFKFTVRLRTFNKDSVDGRQQPSAC